MRAIQYLGSKLNVKGEIVEIIKSISNDSNTIVDAFAGTGVIGNELKLDYRIVSNDIQKYSYLINGVLLSPSVKRIACNISIEKHILENEFYIKNMETLSNIFKYQLEKEKEIIDNNNLDLLAEFTSSQLFYDGTNYKKGSSIEFDKTYKNVLDYFSLENIKQLKSNDDLYMLFSLYYLNGYFSLYQCITIDSIRYAISKMQDEEIKKYLLFLLLHSVSEITCSVGKQFAQPIKLKEKNLKIKEAAAIRCMRDWKLSVLKKMEDMHDKVLREVTVSPYDNITLNLEISDLLYTLKNQDKLIYYLDPPYTIDHYSRFYHVLEVLIEYDYPELEKRTLRGKQNLFNGRYPINRFQSPLSIPSKAKEQFEMIFKAISDSKSKVVLSYSDAVNEGRSRVVSKKEIIDLLEKYFKNIEVYQINHNYRKLNKDEVNNTQKSTRELVFVGENNG